MAFDIDDGLTFKGTTRTEYNGQKGLPVVAFTYRPALASELARWRFDINHAMAADAEFAASTRLLVDHLVAWNVLAKKMPAPITHDALKRLPEAVLGQLVDAVVKWAPAEQEAIEGNSSGG